MSKKLGSPRPGAATALFILLIIESAIWGIFFLISLFDFVDLIFWVAINGAVLALHVITTVGFGMRLSYIKYITWVLNVLYFLAAITIVVLVVIVVTDVPEDPTGWEDLGKALAIIFGGAATVGLLAPAIVNSILLSVKSTRQWFESSS